MSQESRQPPRFVPTLTHMVPPAPRPEPAPVASADMPAAFAELLKDWPSLGEPAEPAERTPELAPLGQDTNVQDANAEHYAEHPAERIAQRAEALVMQRLPGLMAGLVASAVRDAMAAVEAEDAGQPKRS